MMTKTYGDSLMPFGQNVLEHHCYTFTSILAGRCIGNMPKCMVKTEARFGSKEATVTIGITNEHLSYVGDKFCALKCNDCALTIAQ